MSPVPAVAPVAFDPRTLASAVIGVEGGYSNNPADRGGETIWGITAATARAFGYTGPMIAMPRSVAVDIYVKQFWLQPRFDSVYPVSAQLAFKLFDIGVNKGPAAGVKFLQRALNVLNQQGKSYPDINVDGGLGALTLQCLKTMLVQRGPDGVKVIIGMVTSLQSVAYILDAEQNPSQETFEYGWQLNRVIGTLTV